MGRINMRYMPSPNREYTMTFPALAGGLNIWELDYRLSPNESPDMQNLMWKDGYLNSRDGQVWVDSETDPPGLAMYEGRFHGYLVYHAGTSLWAINPEAETPQSAQLYTNENLTTRGTFILFDTALYYKSAGFYIRIALSGENLVATDVVGYTPVTYVNCDPTTGAGDSYQPENRISPYKTMWYNANGGQVYQLPVLATEVTNVEITNPVQGETYSYTYDDTTGVVTITPAPPVTTPATNNTVRITYSLANTNAYNSIMDCPYAVAYGGTGALIVVVAGCPAQPNAYFWSGHNVTMDPTYFPMEQYQLAGDANEGITGFGSQQSFLVLFKERTIGRTKMSTAEVSGSGINATTRTTVDMPYVLINNKVGCDLPWSIQLIDNNLVWCNTEHGVCYLKDSSWAYENNFMEISQKVNGSKTKRGLLTEVREADPNLVCSCDDTKRYWLVVNGKAYVWDYSLSDNKNPSWFYFTDIDAVAFATEYEDVYHVDTQGRITVFERVFADYGGVANGGWPIRKVYQFATQMFGSYDALKNVNSVIIATRSDTNGTTTVTYVTDYERRKDLTDLKVRHYRLIPRNLAYRSLLGRGFAEVFRRRPMCRRVRHFTMRLENWAEGEDLSVVSAQIFYNFQGRERGRQVI